MKKFKVGDMVFHASNNKLRMSVVDIGDKVKCTILTDSGIRKEIDFLPSEIFLADDEKINIKIDLGDRKSKL